MFISFGFGGAPDKIPTKGFLLLERTSDDTIPGIKADIVYSGGLNNGGEVLRLFNEKCGLADEVIADSSWPAGDAKDRRTMERAADLSWHTFSGKAQGGIFGTPKTENSLPVATKLKETKTILSVAVSAPQNTSAGSNANNSGGGGGTPRPAFPKLLISEVQVEGESADSEFVEIYNPNTSSVSLSGWYIQRKTKSADSYSTYAKADLFQNASIAAGGYFTIAREGSGILADIFVDHPLTADNSLVIKNPNGEIVDTVGWGESNGCEGACAPNPGKNKSIERNSDSGTLVDTGNNFQDFSIQNCPSPKGVPHCAAVEDNNDNEDLQQNDNQNDGNTGTPSDSASNVVISEIMAGKEGEADNEFIEFYNPTGLEIDLTGFVLKRKASFESQTEQVLVNAESFLDKKIPSHGFFLVASPEYTGEKLPDIVYSSAYHLAYDEDVLLLYDDINKIDEAKYEKIDPGQSLERAAYFDGGCVSPTEDNEFLGNGCDSNETPIFYVRGTPNPQNSKSLPEPREKPAIPSGFATEFIPSLLSLKFDWAKPEIGELKWKIKEIDSDPYLADLMTENNEAQVVINEVGRSYRFEIRAIDEDNLASDAAVVEIKPPGFFKTLAFTHASDDKFVIDGYYEKYPIVPAIFEQTLSWKMAAFYLNQDASKEEIVYDSFQPSDNNAIEITYPSCAGGNISRNSLILPDERNFCNTDGGAYSKAMLWDNLEDPHFQVKASLNPFNSIDPENNFLTVAFYAKFSSMPSDGRIPYFKLVAIDKTEYRFQSNQGFREKPILSGLIKKEFHGDSSKLILSWPAASDTDSLDSSLSYKIKFSDNENLDNSEWLDVVEKTRFEKIVSSGDRFWIVVKTTDESDNDSDIIKTEWRYPEAEWSIVQNLANGFSESFGYRVNDVPFLATQSFVPVNDVTANVISLEVRHLFGDDGARLNLSVFDGENEPNFNVLPLGSASAGEFWGLPGNEISFSFSPSIALLANKKYWLVLTVNYSAGDTYSLWSRNHWEVAISSGNPFIRGESGTLKGNLSLKPDEDWWFKIGKQSE